MKKISRRCFLASSSVLFSGLKPSYAFFNFSGEKKDSSNQDDIRGRIFKNDAPEKLWKWSREGHHYKKKHGNKVVCQICPHKCVLSPGDRSLCRSKINYKGKLFSLTYGNPCAIHIDPVEKKPLFHFKPSSMVYSLSTTGCNFRCLNCQNWEISQAKPEKVRHFDLFPSDIVSNAKRSKAKSIAFTYAEAVTFYEYMADIAKLSKKNGLHNLLISNGYINKRPLSDLCQNLDAANINLKAFSDTIYKKLNGGRLKPVLDTFKTLHENNIHFEITNLVVPGYVDNTDMVKKMCEWIINNVGINYPLHFSRFFPKYKLNRLAPTPVATLTLFRKIAMQEGLRYVYVGNVLNHEGNHTYCHNCKKLLIERNGYFITADNLDKGKCKFCKSKIPGIW